MRGLGVWLCLCACHGSHPPPTAWEPPPVTGSTDVAFDVDLAAAGTDRAEDVLRTGLTAYLHEEVPDFAWDKTASELRLGPVLFDPMWQVITPSRDLADLQARLSDLDPYVTRVLDHDGSILFTIESIPRWLSPDPDNNTQVGVVKTWYSLPPNDWAGWQELMATFAGHYSTHGNRIAFLIGSEPDNYWLGSEDDFHLYYRYAVAGIRGAAPRARVGGITPSNYGQTSLNLTHTETSAPLLENWLAYCHNESLAVDFVSWHSYPAGNPVPIATTQWGHAARAITSWAQAAGYSNPTLLVTDWPDWKARSQNDTVYRSSWVASGLIAMARDRMFDPTHLLRDVPVDDALAASDGSYGGGDGIITKAGAIKPSYNFYRMLGATRGNLVPVDTGDTFISALATADPATGDIYLLVSYFVPEDWLLIQNDLVVGFDSAAAEAELMQSGMSKTQLDTLLQGVLDGSVDVESLSFSENVKTYLRAARALEVASETRRSQTARTTVTMRGLRDGTWRSELQLVGRDHSNPHAHRAELQAAVAPYLDRNDMAGAFAQVQAFDERADVALEPPVRGSIAASGGAATIALDLAPYDVALLVLRPN